MTGSGTVSVHVTRIASRFELPLGLSEPVRCGIPFAPGVIAADAGWILLDEDGGAREHQATALARWPDGSTKWLLLEFAASTRAEKSSWWLQPSAGPVATLAPLGDVSGATVRLRSADAIVSVGPGNAIEIVRGGRREATIRVTCTDAERGTYSWRSKVSPSNGMGLSERQPWRPAQFGSARRF